MNEKSKAEGGWERESTDAVWKEPENGGWGWGLSQHSKSCSAESYHIDRACTLLIQWCHSVQYMCTWPTFVSVSCGCTSTVYLCNNWKSFMVAYIKAVDFTWWASQRRLHQHRKKFNKWNILKLNAKFWAHFVVLMLFLRLSIHSTIHGENAYWW